LSNSESGKPPSDSLRSKYSPTCSSRNTADHLLLVPTMAAKCELHDAYLQNKEECTV
jgi:hypothetical protein